MKLAHLILIMIVLSSIVLADVTEDKVARTGKAMGKDYVVNAMIQEAGVSEDIGDAVNSSSPKTYEDIQDVCEKTSFMRFILGILTIGSLLGLFTLRKIGIPLSAFTAVTYLNYLCLI